MGGGVKWGDGDGSEFFEMKEELAEILNGENREVRDEATLSKIFIREVNGVKALLFGNFYEIDNAGNGS